VHRPRIAGQTAPSPGITLTQAGLSIRADHVEVQHLAIRPGDSSAGSPPGERNGVSVGGYEPAAAYSVSLKNLSLTWATDENFSTWYQTTHDVWLRNSIVAEGLYDSIHPKGPHSDGVLIGTDTKNVTLDANLIAFNFDRNPYVEPGSSAKVTNNLIYGWGTRGPWNICNLTNNFGNLSPVVGAFVGNLWIPASYSYQLDGSIYAGIIAPTSLVYVDDNYGPGRPNNSLPNSAITSLVDPSVLTTTCPFATGCTARTLRRCDRELRAYKCRLAPKAALLNRQAYRERCRKPWRKHQGLPLGMQPTGWPSPLDSHHATAPSRPD